MKTLIVKTLKLLLILIIATAWCLPNHNSIAASLPRRQASTVYLDATISLYSNPLKPEEREPYERIIRYFADGVFESSNGARQMLFGFNPVGLQEAYLVGERRAYTLIFATSLVQAVSWAATRQPSAVDTPWRTNGDTISIPFTMNMWAKPATIQFLPFPIQMTIRLKTRS